MASEIEYKKRFKNKLIKVLKYLEETWSQKVSIDFLSKVDRRIEMIKNFPDIGVESTKIENVRGILITRHHWLFYKKLKDKILILNLYETQMNPRKNPYQ